MFAKHRAIKGNNVECYNSLLKRTTRNIILYVFLLHAITFFLVLKARVSLIKGFIKSSWKQFARKYRNVYYLNNINMQLSSHQVMKSLQYVLVLILTARTTYTSKVLK